MTVRVYHVQNSYDADRNGDIQKSGPQGGESRLHKAEADEAESAEKYQVVEFFESPNWPALYLVWLLTAITQVPLHIFCLLGIMWQKVMHRIRSRRSQSEKKRMSW